MSTADTSSVKAIANKDELVNWFAQAATPAARRLIGVEHEKPPFYLDDQSPVPFASERAGKGGISDFIRTMVQHHGWDAGVPEQGQVVDIHKDNVNWTFEPGLQMETGGAPLRNVHQIARETDRVIGEALGVTEKLGFGMLAMGYHPTHNGMTMPRMPKSRYQLIRQFAVANGYTNAPDMMSCTSTVQVNLGYTSEDDMVKMLRVSLSLQPIAAALFASSPFANGRDSGFNSYRSEVIRNNLGGRYGFMLPVAFDQGFGYEMFVDYALKQMPLMGIYKGNTFIDAGGRHFADFMQGQLDICPGQQATLADWQNHLNTIWSEVRLRRFLEMRGADNGPAEMIKALPALWVGLLYDPQALDDAYEMVRHWTNEDREYLRAQTPRTGLQTAFMGATVQDVAKNMLALSEAGLRRRGVLDAKGNDESLYLEPLHEIAHSGLNFATRLKLRLEGEWNGDIRKVFQAMSYANAPSVLAPAPVAQPAAARTPRRGK